MTSHTNQASDMDRGQVPDTSEEQVANAMTAIGVKRGEFPDGAATVLVLDHFRHLWKQYEQRVPQEASLLFVRDTTAAEQAMRMNPAIGVVIVQGLSRKVNNDAVDMRAQSAEDTLCLQYAWLQDCQRRGESVNDWLDSYDHTLAFLKSLQQQGFEGLVQVVSRTLERYNQHQLLDLKDLRVQYMDKQHFFDGTFTAKANMLWRQIERLEKWERSTGRRLSPTSGVGGDLDRWLMQLVQPYPTEDKLFDRWERATSRYGNGCPEATACEEVLTWLENLKLVIKTGDIRSIYDRASMLPGHRLTCDCREFTDKSSDYYWARFIHLLHNDINQAVWDILDMAGLMEWMRLELEFGLASQSPDFAGYGRHAKREHGMQLREFFQLEGPSKLWLDWRVERR